MRCLYCDKEINDYTLYSLLFENDELCNECRKKMRYNHHFFYVDDLLVETFYEYNSEFKDLLLQYKECYDEALKNIFLYKIDNYLKIKYYDYEILYVPSCKEKINERGFNHLEEIFSSLKLKKVEGLTMIEQINQKNKSMLERTKMISNYTYSGKDLKKVLIVDDVFTSGSSLKGVYYAIKGHFQKCRAIVLSKI